MKSAFYERSLEGVEVTIELSDAHVDRTCQPSKPQGNTVSVLNSNLLWLPATHVLG